MIYGISGKAQSGKDTMAKFIIEAKPEFEIKKFADPVKEIASIILGCNKEDLEDDKFKKSNLPDDWTSIKLIYDNGHTEIRDPSLDIIDSKHIFSLKRRVMTPRLLLQLLGTECGRDIIHSNIWCNILFRKYTPDKNWIITDVRFVNEADYIHRLGGKLIRINRYSDLKMDHESETQLDTYPNFDVLVDNNHDLTALKNTTNLLIKSKAI